jgi:hypothetical protein
MILVVVHQLGWIICKWEKPWSRKMANRNKVLGKFNAKTKTRRKKSERGLDNKRTRQEQRRANRRRKEQMWFGEGEDE